MRKKLNTNLFTWRISRQKRKIHKNEVNQSYIKRERLRTV